MKKILISMVIVTMLMTACNSGEGTKSEEELREEIRIELEAEAKLEEELKEEIRKEIEAEIEAEAEEAEAEEAEEVEVEAEAEVVEVEASNTEIKETMNQDFENGIQVGGELIDFLTPIGLCLYSEYGLITFEGKEYDQISLKDDILKYVNNDSWTFNHEEGRVLDSNFPEYFTIEFDPTTAYEDEDFGILVVEDYRVVADPYGIGASLIDHSQDTLPTSYYQDVLYAYSFVYGNEESDIKNNLGYQENTVFKEAVDIILSKGYALVQTEGYYKVVNENAVNLEGTYSVKELCDILGISLQDVETKPDMAYYEYYSEYSDDELYFVTFHDGDFTGNEIVSTITIRGFEYKLYGIGLGESLLNTYEILDNKFEKAVSIHADQPAKYVYDVNSYYFNLNYIGWNIEEDINKDDLVKLVSLYMPLD